MFCESVTWYYGRNVEIAYPSFSEVPVHHHCTPVAFLFFLAIVASTVSCRDASEQVAPSEVPVTKTSAESEIALGKKADLGEPSALPLPSTMGNAEYEARLFPFLNKREYKALGWTPDKRVRDTGPFINGKYYGTHPAVKIFYSPEIITWLEGGKEKAIPDGAMIIKEQYEPPAVRYQGLDDDQLFEHLSSWTVMVKDSGGSHDGWYWSNPAKDQKVVDNHEYPFDHPIGGFGIYCVRCHASTESHGETNEYTFSSLRNVEGYPGEPLLFRVDDSWRKNTDHEEPVSSEAADELVEESPHPVSNEELLA
ncbi:MAG: cytochrome P460 family protein, partial [Lacipirellulaceae bacterium]